MIMINGNWEYANSLEDISNIIRENLSRELADKLDTMLPIHTEEEYYSLECICEDNEMTINTLEDELDFYENRVKELEEKIEKTNKGDKS